MGTPKTVLINGDVIRGVHVQISVLSSAHQIMFSRLRRDRVYFDRLIGP